MYQEIESGSVTEWLTDLLPTHVGCSRIMTYNFSIPPNKDGISTAMIISLAKLLLEQILVGVEKVYILLCWYRSLPDYD